jgi:hypothetical protein
MTSLPATPALDRRPASPSDAQPIFPREDADRRHQPTPKTAKAARFNWQLEADGVPEAIERIYR